MSLNLPVLRITIFWIMFLNLNESFMVSNNLIEFGMNTLVDFWPNKNLTAVKYIILYLLYINKNISY